MEPIPKPEKAAIAIYENLADSLEEKLGAERSKMFGMQCLKVRKKAFCGLFGNDMVFKLTGDEHKEALTLNGAKLFDPSGMNQPMKEWVQVPFVHKRKWESLAIEALKYVG